MKNQLSDEELEGVAVIGMSGRFPGARDLDAFWRNLRDGVESISTLPEEALVSSGVDAAQRRDPRYVRACAALDDVDQFDASFFGFSPREAELIDPQHRIFMECAWEALEHAGYDPAAYDGAIGVYAGSSMSGYWMKNLNGNPLTEGWPGWFHTLLGNDKDYLATHLSYKLNLKGPSVSVQTACSTSLVAVHMACTSLLDRECDMALAGGITVRTPHRTGYVYAEGGITSPDGRCRPFDASAGGTIFGSGAGVVVLRRLRDALADGDPIHAILRGSAINNDGAAKVGFTAPSELGQAQVIAEALLVAGVEAADLQYVEAHGTGTSIGDLIEIAALKRAHGDGRPCAVGSVKGNVGHLESAAGIAGLIKTILALKHRQIPPSLHCQTPNPTIDFASSRFYVNTALRAWESGGGPRRAGVSSFGIGGTNAHVVVEEAPPSPPRAEPRARGDHRPQLLVLSARAAPALRALAERTARLLTSATSDSLATSDSSATSDSLATSATSDSSATADSAPSLADVCFTASARRSHHPHRVALAARSGQEMADGLNAYARGEAHAGLSHGVAQAGALKKVAFVFSGHGAAWAGMGRQLLAEEPAFRAVFDRCQALVARHTALSLRDELLAPEASSRLHQTEILQPALFAIQVALAELWRSWGIVPDAVIGHSCGEVAAAHVAGALTLEEATRLACLRGRVAQQAQGRGQMALVEMPAAEAARVLRGVEDRVVIAAVNDPTTVVLSGEPAALSDLLGRLERDGVHHRRMRVDYPFHHPLMTPLQQALEEGLGRVQARSTTTAIFSTVIGGLADGRDLDARYWGRNLREPVQFAAAVGAAVEKGYRVFVEIGPHPVHALNLQRCLQARGVEGRVVSSLRRDQDERACVLDALGALYTEGLKPTWASLNAPGARCVELPAYPWQRERHWIEPAAGGLAHRAHLLRGGHPLLGAPFLVATQPGARFWEGELSVAALPYLADHRVDGEVVYPGAATVEMALSAATAVFGPGAHAVRDVVFERMLTVPEAEPRQVQLVIMEDGPGLASFEVSSRAGEAWTRHTRGRLSRVVEESGWGDGAPAPLKEVQARCPTAVSRAAHYEALARWGLGYGESFRGVEQLWLGAREALGRVCLPDSVVSQAASYRIHPALLDACLHVLAGLFPEARAGEGAYVPVGAERARVGEAPGRALWVHARLRPSEDAGDAALIGDLDLRQDDGRVVGEIRGLRVKRLDEGARADSDEAWGHALEWRRAALPEAPRPPSGEGAWLVLADDGAAGPSLAALLGQRGEACVCALAGARYERVAEGRYRLNPSEPGDYRALLRDAFGGAVRCRGVVHLWSLDATPVAETTAATLEADQRRGSASALLLAQAIVQRAFRDAPRLWLVTRGAQAAGNDAAEVQVAQAPLWGMASTLALEHPELCCSRVDLSSPALPEEAEMLLRELESAGAEEQIALRSDGRYVARLVQTALAGDGEALETSARAQLAPAGDRPFSLETPRPGVLEQLTLRETERRIPGPGEVAIEVEAAGLNFLDVLLALGAIPDEEAGERGPRLGGECSGKVVALGEGVTDLEVGQPVFGFATGSFSSFVVTARALVVPKPTGLGLDESATLPVVFVTAYYALAHVGRLSRGERVLIHAGAGGVGLAAIQWAQHVGAEVFATAGSEEKRALLRSLGVRHVSDSRSLKFADDILRFTGGEGVDVVLNSLSGDAIAAGFGLLRDHGRFLEIGKRDYYANEKLGLKPFLKNLSFSLVDLRAMIAKRPGLVSTLLQEVVRLFETGVFKPLPCRSFPVSTAAEAFSTMAQGRHIGKLALRLRDPEARIAPRARSATSSTARLRDDGSYLITGGLGGLGLSVAAWMVERGARHLVLLGRSGASEPAREAVRAMEAAGARVAVVAADVSRRDDLARVLAGVERDMPALRGVVHAAAVLDDRTSIELDAERLRRVMAPKMLGAWNLHALTADRPLDFFVLYSSAGALLGSVGQANYVAANAFLDALAHHRRLSGKPALSIDWGPFSDVGLAAAHRDRGERLSLRGLASLTPAEGLRALEGLLFGSRTQIGVMKLDLGQWLEFYPSVAGSPLFAELDRDPRVQRRGTEDAQRLRQALSAASPGDRVELLEQTLREQLGRVLRMEASKIDRLAPFERLGLDSLTSMELRNRIELAVGLKLTAVLLFTFSTVGSLAQHLCDELAPHAQSEAEAEAKAPPPPPELAPPSSIAESVARLDDAELLALFDEPLRSV